MTALEWMILRLSLWFDLRIEKRSMVECGKTWRCYGVSTCARGWSFGYCHKVFSFYTNWEPSALGIMDSSVSTVTTRGGSFIGASGLMSDRSFWEKLNQISEWVFSLGDTCVLESDVSEILSCSDTRDGLLSAVESERAVPYRDVARWVRAGRVSGGKTATVRSRFGPNALRPREEKLFVCLPGSDISNVGILLCSST